MRAMSRADRRGMLRTIGMLAVLVALGFSGCNHGQISLKNHQGGLRKKFSV